MFTPQMIVAQAKIDELQAQAAANRLAKESRNTRSDSRGRLSVAIGNIRSLLSLDGSTGLPKLTNYPYRS
jgi:hypothetical protein